jgi:hypothetical protein
MLVVPGYFKDNVFVPEDSISIPDGTKALVSLEDAALNEAREAERQLPIFEEFFAALDKIDEELPPEFDQIIARGLKFGETVFS